MSQPTPTQGPPTYVLISATPSSGTGPVAPISSSLSHPTVIHYQYADDPPLHLIPQPGQQHTVLVMDFDDRDRTSNAAPFVQSLSEDVVVTGVRLSDAPGAPVDGVNPHIYVVETSSKSSMQRQPSDPLVVDSSFVAQFKQRNNHLRKVVAYGAKPVANPAAFLESGTSPPSAVFTPQVPEFPQNFH